MSFRPESFGKYFLVDKIAVGGMAEIFKAKQFGPGGFEKILVIKRILSHLGEDEDFVKMFQDEAKISSTLSHSNIIHLYDFGKIRNNYFIAMEYCEGKDLKTVMKKCQEIGRPLPVEYAVYIIHEVCKGLDHAHRKKDENNREMNILHRDISPSNVIVSYDEGKVKIADFGIAKAQNATYKTKAGVLKGKFEYMSPEQASGLSIDRRSDVFSVGICFYEILTRRRLFKTDSDLKTLELIRNPLIPPPSHLNPQVREELDAIVMKALARNPDDRYQEAWQMQHDLREFMRAMTPPTSPDLIALSLANFMREIFDREIKQEKERLELGSRAARELIAQREQSGQPEEDEEDYNEAWEIPSDSSRVVSGMTPPAGGTAVRLMIEERERNASNRSLFLGLGVAGLVIVGGGLLLRGVGGSGDVVATQQGPADTTASAAVEPGTRGGSGDAAPVKKGYATLRLNATPVEARIYVNREMIGRAPLVYEKIPAGESVTLKVEYDGYETYSRSLTATAGQIIDIETALRRESSSSRPSTPKASASSASSSAASTPAPAPAPAPVASSGRIDFSSSPAGASVSVNGRPFCTTPCAMLDGRSEAMYEIEMALEGHQAIRERIRYPSQGTYGVNRTLQRIEIGQLTLSIKDGLSAEIFIDGKRKTYAPLLNREPVPAGRHTITLRSPVAGLEKSYNVEIIPGQEYKLLADLRE